MALIQTAQNTSLLSGRGGPSVMDSLFQRSLARRLNQSPHPQQPPACTTTSTAIVASLSKSINEVRREIKSTDPQTKITRLHTSTPSICPGPLSTWSRFLHPPSSTQNALAFWRFIFPRKNCELFLVNCIQSFFFPKRNCGLFQDFHFFC